MRLITKLRRAPSRSSARVLPIGASAPSETGRVRGVLILPVPVEWSQRVLPAGGYRFVVSTASSSSWVYMTGNEDACVFYAASSEPAPGAFRSEIGLVHDGRCFHVRSLTLREAETTLLFDARRPGSGEPHLPEVLYVLLQPFGEGLRSPTSDSWRIQ